MIDTAITRLGGVDGVWDRIVGPAAQARAKK